MNGDDDGFGLALPFDTDNHDFAMGFEMGRLWEQFKQPEAFDQTIHACNAEMVIRISEATGRPFKAEHTEDPDWMFLYVEEMSDVA